MIFYGYDVNIRQIPLPFHVGGVTVPTPDDSYDIYINSRLSDAAQDRALRHELGHVLGQHFDLDCPLTDADKEKAADIIARCLYLPI